MPEDEQQYVIADQGPGHRGAVKKKKVERKKKVGRPSKDDVYAERCEQYGQKYVDILAGELSVIHACSHVEAVAGLKDDEFEAALKALAKEKGWRWLA